MSKSVNVEYFAQIRLVSGVAREAFALPDDASVDVLIQTAIARHGAPMRKLLAGPDDQRSAGVIVAIDGVQILPGSCGQLKDGSSVLLVPAISGG